METLECGFCTKTNNVFHSSKLYEEKKLFLESTGCQAFVMGQKKKINERKKEIFFVQEEQICRPLIPKANSS